MSLFSRLAALFSALAIVCAITGCGKQPQPYFNTQYSYNLAKLPDDWPGEEPEKNLKPGELELYEEMGRPDIIRVLYDNDRSIVTRTEVDIFFKRRPGHEKKTIADFDHSWIYLTQGYEVVFNPSGSYEKLDLTDKIRTLYRFGDPQNKRYNERLDQDTWIYYSKGKRFKFSGDMLVATERFTPMGRWQY